MDSELAKQASEVIKSLRDDYNRLKVATDLTFKLYKSGSVAAENLESLFNSLLSKTDQELEVFEKVAELQLTAEFLSFGKVCDRPDLDGLDPITRCLIEDM